LIGLDRSREILSWPLDELDPVRRSMRMQVLRVILPIGIKALLKGQLDPRERPDRQCILSQLARDLRPVDNLP
jgi:hypothetical protein